MVRGIGFPLASGFPSLAKFEQRKLNPGKKFVNLT
jgi:hypothetical protein